MHRTLFLYIFKDLLKVFLLASGAIAGIMSFGGLLRPLTQHGLDLGQVGQMLAYFMPAMTNYSWPIATLFATTFVYGRLSADNELTACRAAGLSYWRILQPAFWIGIVVTICSSLFLAYLVPNSFLKAEKVVYSNLARLVAGEIDRKQRVNLNTGLRSVTIFARGAEVLEPNPAQPDLQAVELKDVSIVTFVNEKEKDQPLMPEEFYLADSATVFIQMPRDVNADVEINVALANGMKIPQPSESRKRPLVLGSIGTAVFGPYPLQSAFKEATKFMDLNRLLELRSNPAGSRKIVKQLNELIRIDQSRMFQRQLLESARAGGPIVLSGRDGTRDVTYTVHVPTNAAGRPAAQIAMQGEKLVLTAGTVDAPGIAFTCDSPQTPFSGRAREVLIHSTISAGSDADARPVYSKIEVRDAILLYRDEESPLQSKEWNVATPMPDDVAQLASRDIREYLRNDPRHDREKRLHIDLLRQQNQVESELHARFGFAVSCMLLSLVGAVIGMMFKSGNFVTAFAISVGPALVSIVLIVTGQHVCETAPRAMHGGTAFSDPTRLGLPLLWSGNLIVALLGGGLYYRIRQT